jgi:hypothetical protein
MVCRSLHQILATKEQKGPSEVKEFLPVRSIALGAFERNYVRTQLRSNAGTRLELRSSVLASHAVALIGPTIPSLPACAVAVIRARPHIGRLNACISAFKCTTCIFPRVLSIGRVLRAFCHCRPCSALFSCNTLI